MSFESWDNEVDSYEKPRPKPQGGTRERKELPPGEYSLMVVELKYLETQKGPYILWKLQTDTGQEHEKWAYLEEVSNRNWAFNELLTAGLNARNWTEAMANLDKLKGKVLACKVTPPNAKGFKTTYVNALVGQVEDEIPF